MANDASLCPCKTKQNCTHLMDMPSSTFVTPNQAVRQSCTHFHQKTIFPPHKYHAAWQWRQLHSLSCTTQIGSHGNCNRRAILLRNTYFLYACISWQLVYHMNAKPLHLRTIVWSLSLVYQFGYNISTHVQIMRLGNQQRVQYQSGCWEIEYMF